MKGKITSQCTTSPGSPLHPGWKVDKHKAWNKNSIVHDCCSKMTTKGLGQIKPTLRLSLTAFQCFHCKNHSYHYTCIASYHPLADSLSAYRWGCPHIQVSVLKLSTAFLNNRELPYRYCSLLFAQLIETIKSCIVCREIPLDSYWATSPRLKLDKHKAWNNNSMVAPQWSQKGRLKPTLRLGLSFFFDMPPKP